MNVDEDSGPERAGSFAWRMDLLDRLMGKQMVNGSS